MPSLHTTLTDQVETLTNERADLMAKAETAGSFDDVRDRINEIDDELPGIEADLAIASRDRERIRKTPSAKLEEGPITELVPYQTGAVSLGDQFLGSEDWQEYASKVAPNGKWSLKSRVESPKIEIAGSILPRRHSLITGGSVTSGGALVIPSQTGIFDEGTFQRELSLLDVITRGTTDSDAVEYVRVTGFTNSAAPVPEADSVDPTDTTGLKPQSALALERINETVKTIAHWEAVTKRALADAGQMRTILDSFLRYGLLEALEDQILTGDDTGEEFDGILHVSGTGDQAFTTDIATTIRKAKTKVRTQGKSRANAVAMNPEDWEALDLFMTFEGGGSNFRQASDETPPRIWGLRVVETEALDPGTAIVGDFRKAVLWDRQQTTVQASDGVDNYFLKNMVAVLAELRAAFGVIRPAAFVIADVSAGS